MLNQIQIPQNSVVLFGSGVSMWAPSDIPTGAKVRDALLNLLFNDQMRNWHKSGLRSWLDWIPFETINEFAPRSIDLSKFYSKFLDTDTPNEIHKQLVQLATSRNVIALITTNYDCGLEKAAGKSSPMYPVLDPSDSLPKSSIPYFKIHGCCSVPFSLVYRLNQEAILSNEKANYLHNLVDGNTLIVIGYSGVDFEICPVISSSNAKQVIWYYQSNLLPHNYETHGYKLISSKIKTIPFPVDLSNGLPWFQSKVHLLPSNNRNFEKALLAIVTEEERYLWAIRIAATIGYADQARKLLLQLPTIFMSKPAITECNNQKGFALFQSGCYRDSAKAFLQTAFEAEQERDYEHYITSLLDASDSWRVGGYYGRSLFSFLKAKLISIHHISSKITCRLALKEALLLKSISIVIQTCQLRLIKLFFMNIVHKRGFKLVSLAKEHSALAGLVFDQTQLDELASIFTNRKSTQHVEMDGYEHLGYFSASTTLFRKKSLHLPISKSTISKAEKRYSLMVLLGNHPEAWKVAARMAEISTVKNNNKWEQRVRDQIQHCQYTKWHRKHLIKWIRNGANMETI